MSTQTSNFVRPKPIPFDGYLPTDWIAILFAISCLLSLCSTAPALFLKYRNVTLGILVTGGLIFQFTGHTNMAFISFLPDDITLWILERVAFMSGKCIARAAVYYTYYTAFRRLSKYCPHTLILLASSMILVGMGFGVRVIFLGFEIALIHYGYSLESFVFALPSGVALVSTFILLIDLIYVIRKSKSDIPWYRMNWMMGHYITLQIVPIVLLTQDGYDLAQSLTPYRNEMVELFCDMGMTKALLVMLGSQSYETAYAWSQKRPYSLAMIEDRIRNFLQQRKLERERS
jgi:hypothetical protein